MISHTLRAMLCHIGIHKKMPFYDIEYSRHGEAYYCYYCDVEFDWERRAIKEER